MSTQLIKSGKEVAKQKFPKTDSRYWEGAVFKPRFTQKGSDEDGTEEGGTTTREVSLFSMRISFQGERLTIPLSLANKAAAGRKARDIYLSLIAEGKEATLAKYHPRRINRATSTTTGKVDATSVGDYIAAAKELTAASPRTIAGYVTSLRMIAAGVAGIKAGSGKFDYRKGGHAEWLRKVDSVPLSSLTTTALEEWKHRYLKKRKGNPVEERKAKNSVNSFIRQARSLFAPKIAKLLEERLDLPDPLPFREVGLFPRSSTRYVSRIDIRKLVADALDELGSPMRDGESRAAYGSRSEQFKVFLLAAFAGMRRNEIDKLLWEQLDLAKGLVEIRETAFFKPKSDESCGQVELEQEVVEHLARLKKESKGRFVLQGSTSASGKKTPKAVQWYRAQAHFDRLMDWLRKKGVTDQKPLHLLRKEAGNLVCGTEGLHAASRFLRHGDIRVTAEHYLDKKPKVTVGMGSLLRNESGGASP